MSRKPQPKPIFVSKPFLPPLAELLPSLEQIWESQILTNFGPFHEELEFELCKYLGVKHISLISNATLALSIALKASGVSGDVITTPFSFIATSQALLWNNLTPIFVDIDSTNLNIDPNKIEAAITENTSAILPVHCYGNPCDTETISSIAKKYDLKVIYDAAHAFGVKCHCGSLLNHGDYSVVSFHATKVFNTFEGGAIVSPDIESKKKVDLMRNFGIFGETSVLSEGINGKMNEISSAFGLIQLRYIEEAISKRKMVADFYLNRLRDLKGIRIVGPFGQVRHNYSYFPILVTDEFPLSRNELYDSLKARGIFTRRYFFPLISNHSIYGKLTSVGNEELPRARQAAERILCLPIYPDISYSELDLIIESIRRPVG